MGRVRTKTIKRAAKVLLEKHYIKLTNDFHINKKILSEVAKVPTKSLRNKIAGYATHLVKRIQRGPVKGISLKVQEEERERRLDWVPKESEINIEKVLIPLFRSPSMPKLTKCSRRDSVMTSSPRSAATLKSKHMRSSEETPEEAVDREEAPEEIELTEGRESPEREEKRRRERRLRRKLLSNSLLLLPLLSKRKQLLPSVKAEEEVLVRVNSDLCNLNDLITRYTVRYCSIDLI